jgi:DNA processing protein
VGLVDAERFALLRLIRSPGIGPARFFKLYHHYGSAIEAIQHFKEATRSLPKASLVEPGEVEEEMKAHEKIGAQLVTFLDPEYPPLLRQIKDYPPVLSILGATSVLKKPLLGVVGSRSASINGQYFITRLIEDLIPTGLSIVSGFARGMDTAAHEASLEAGTVGVLAGGVDIIYPEENARLYQKVQENGCFVSEMPLGLCPQGRHFPRRNRLISGMAQGILISEGRYQSGSMITAEYALEQGRDVFAVPGSPLDPRCSGSNSLLKQGAILVTRAADIVDTWGTVAVIPRKQKNNQDQASNALVIKEADEEMFLSLLSADPLPRNVVLEQFGGTAERFNILCSRLELEGKITCSFGGLLSLCLKES